MIFDSKLNIIYWKLSVHSKNFTEYTNTHDDQKYLQQYFIMIKYYAKKIPNSSKVHKNKKNHDS